MGVILIIVQHLQTADTPQYKVSEQIQNKLFLTIRRIFDEVSNVIFHIILSENQFFTFYCCLRLENDVIFHCLKTSFDN